MQMVYASFEAFMVSVIQVEVKMEAAWTSEMCHTTALQCRNQKTGLESEFMFRTYGIFFFCAFMKHLLS